MANKQAGTGLPAGSALAIVFLSVLAAGCSNLPTFPSDATPPPGGGNQTVLSFQQVFAGSTHSCTLANGGRALCWGSGGDLGDGTTRSQPTPVRVQGPQTFRELDVSSYTCGTTTNDQAWCWGTNSQGRLGDGTADYRPFPTAVSTKRRFGRITTGAVHTCAVSLENEMWCWGSNRFGQLSSHPDTLSLLPIPVAPTRRFVTVDAGGLRTCAIETSGDTYCWGEAFGTALVNVSGPIEFASITLGGVHACGLTAAGEAFCFGSNTEGQLGNGTFLSTAVEGPPVPVDTEERFVAISAGEFHTCAVTAEGAAWCWGRDDLGQLGDGDPRSGSDTARKPSPTLVLTENTFIDFLTISAGRFLSCATTADGRGFCWGFGTGSATTPFSTSPVEIGS
ncbi:MAG: RCC1 domain-containing protein [Gemmatimonadota bacterium]